MFNSVLRHITEGNTYLGLEIFEQNGAEHFALLKLRKTKGELVLQQETTAESLEELVADIDKTTPLFITVNSPKILKKQLSTQNTTSAEALVVNAFPNLDLDNFYYQILKGQTTSVVSIGKREYVEQALARIKEMGISPVQIALGISPLEILELFIKKDLGGSNFEANFDASGFQGFDTVSGKVDTTLDLEGIKLKSTQLLSFAHILGFVQQKLPHSNFSDLNQNLWSVFKNKRVFTFGLRAGLGVLLVVLVINFLLFNHYYTKNQELETSLASNEYQGASIKEVLQRVDLKEEKLKSLLSSKNSKTTYYLDELGKSVPNSIFLSDIAYQPLLMPVKQDKYIELGENNLRVSGISKNSIEFTVWSDNLEMQKWVKRVEIVAYEYLSKSSANFTLNLVLNDAE